MRATIKKLFINPERDNPDYQSSMHTLLRCVTGTTGATPVSSAKTPKTC